MQFFGKAAKGREGHCQFGASADKKIDWYNSIALAFPSVVEEGMYCPAVVMAAARENAVN